MIGKAKDLLASAKDRLLEAKDQVKETTTEAITQVKGVIKNSENLDDIGNQLFKKMKDRLNDKEVSDIDRDL